jgi:transcriptional regulator with XRE-family HTH domain
MAEFVIRGAGAVIARHRQAANLTLEALAQKVKIDKSQLAKYERNLVGISDQRLDAIATALGVPPEQLAHDCLLEIKPEIQSKRIGQLLGSFVNAPKKTASRKPANSPARKKRNVAKSASNPHASTKIVK